MNAVLEARVVDAAGASAPARRTIPFDHTLRFGFDERYQTGKTLQGHIQISVEAPFVALGIGYGFVSAAGTVAFGFPPAPPVPDNALAFREASTPSPRVLETALDMLAARLAAAPSGGLTLGAVLRNGIRINPRYVANLLRPPDGKKGFDFTTLGPRPPDDLFQAVPPPPSLQFLYALHDQGSGRSFQSEPVLSTAGLGAPDGKRPFRQFAAPVEFAPRTTIRVDVTLLQDFVGELHFSLHGYKVLGTPGTPTDLARIARRARRRRVG